MTQDTHAITYQEPSFILALLTSLVVHALVIVGLFFMPKHHPLPEVVTLQADLITGDDLASVQAQIAKAHAQNQTQNKHTTSAKSPAQTSSHTKTTYNDDLAERERAYQAQMQAYAEALDQEILSEIELQQKQLDAQDKERQRQVDELQDKERSNDEIAQENVKELNKTRQNIEKAVAATKTEQVSNQSFDGQDAHSPRPPTVGQGGKISGSSGGGISKNQLQAKIAEHIKPYWTASGEKGTRLQSTITVDSSGNVLSVSVTGGNDYQRQSLEDAIHAASPITPIIGTEFRTFHPSFVTE